MAAARNEAISVRTRGGPGIRVGWALGALAALVVATGVGIAFFTSRPVEPIAEPSRASTLYSADELTVMRLVAQGHIPAESLNAEPFIIKRLVNEGLVPRGAMEAGPAPRTSLYSPQERALMNAVAQGLIPEEVLEGDSFLIKRFFDQGLIPRQAAATGPQR